MVEVTTILQDELDGFVRYSRLGLFQMAEEVYGWILMNEEALFPVTVERAISFLEQGRYGDLSRFLGRKLDEADELKFEQNEIASLTLLKRLADLHGDGDLHSALEVARSWRQTATTSLTPDNLSAVDVS